MRWLPGWRGLLAAGLLLGPALILIASVVLLAAAYPRAADPTDPMWGPFSSDDLTLVELADDILAGRSLTGWHLPGASYLLPDLALLLPCRALFSDLSRLFLAYALLYWGLVAVALTMIGREVGLRRVSAWVCSCLSVASLLAMNLAPAYWCRAREMGHPGSHVGALLVGLLLFAYLLRSFRRGFRAGSWACSAVLAGCATFSDRLVLPQFVGPALAAVVLVRALGAISTRRALAALAWLSAVMAVSWGVQWLLVRLGLRFLLIGRLLNLTTREQLRQHLHDLWARTQPQTLQLVATGAFFLVAGVALLARRREFRGAGAGAPSFALLALLSALSGLVPLFVMGSAGIEGIERYQYTLTVLPPLLLGLLLHVAVRGRARVLGVAAGAALLLVAAGLAQDGLRHGLPHFHQPYPPLAALLDELAREKGCRRGLAGHWEARRYRYLTHEQLAILPATGAGPFIHANNPDAFLSADPNDLRAPQYQFLVLWLEPWLSPRTAQLHFGEPLEKRRCGRYEVWVYRRLNNAYLDAFLRCVLARRLERAAHPQGPSTPRRLAQARDGFAARDAGRAPLTLANGATAEVAFDHLLHGGVLDIAAPPDATFALTLQRGGTPVAEVSVPPVPWPGWTCEYGPFCLRSRLVCLPGSAQEGWDRAVIRYLGPQPAAALSHFLVYPPSTAVSAPGTTTARPRRFEAERMHTLGPADSAVVDPAASGGGARLAERTQRLPAVIGAEMRLPAGRYRADFTLKVDDNTRPDSVVVVQGGKNGVPPLCCRFLAGTDFSLPGYYQTFPVVFETAEDCCGFSFAVLPQGKGRVWIDCIDLLPLDGDPSDGVQLVTH